MKLRTDRPVRIQIEEAIKAGIPLCMDFRLERMGDRIAFLGTAKWIQKEFGEPVTIVESNERSPFLLSSYEVPDLQVRDIPVQDELEYFDCHTLDTLPDAAWCLSQYVGLFKGCLPCIRSQKKELSDITFGLLTGVEYNERRNMNLDSVTLTVDKLGESNSIFVLSDKSSRYVDTVNVSLSEAIEIVAGSKLFIGGDTGLTHVACALGIPTIALYPDWVRYGKFGKAAAQSIADWWQLEDVPIASYQPLGSRFVEIDSNHNWSIDLVLQKAREVLT